jgi:hypothetical protein
MAEVDPYDDSIIRYAIKRHLYDSETKHFRWILENAYDKKREYEKKLQEGFDELETRREKGEAHLKEQLTGEVLEIGNFRNSKSRRQEKMKERQLYISSPRNRMIFFLLTRRHLIGRFRRINKLLRKFLS